MLLPGESEDEITEPGVVAGLVEAWMAGVPHRIIRASTYRFHGLVAEQWQLGNVFLAGDAAHQTPPFFGQGMCHGFRDVANLAWKLAAVARHGADPALLDSYQPERDPHVRSVIGAAVAAGRYICELDPGKAAARDAELRAGTASGKSETAADLIPAIANGIIFAGSPAAGERFIQPATRDGLLDDLCGGGWRLFVRNDGIVGSDKGVSRIDAAALGDGGAVSSWLGANGVDAVLVRPDHYVFGTACGQASGLLDARAQALGLSLEASA